MDKDLAKVEAAVAPPDGEVSMVQPEVVQQIRALKAVGWGARQIAKVVGVSRNTVKSYLRSGRAPVPKPRPYHRKLNQAEAIALFEGPAQFNAAVVQQLMFGVGTKVSVRTVQRAVASRRQELRAAQLATVRFETAPGHQMQIDFGQKRIRIAGTSVTVHFMVATLSFSRRLFVKPFLSERQDDWRDGIAEAFRQFGGVTQTILGDNARALVIDHDPLTHTIRFHPAYLEFCRDWNVIPRACAPYRARTKGKTESGVKYVKRNALAGREFESFAALQAHLERWMEQADRRIHGTTHERPIDRFEREEKNALRPLPDCARPSRERAVRRRVANDALVNVDTIRYSVPYQLVGRSVDVLVGDWEVRIFDGTQLIATHRRSIEPHSTVQDPLHVAGLWRLRGGEAIEAADAEDSSKEALEGLGRSLADYAAIVEGGRQ